MDNIFIERLWRSLKYEEVYLKDYESVTEARAGIERYFRFYNQERLHQSPPDLHRDRNRIHTPYRQGETLQPEGLKDRSPSAGKTGTAQRSSLAAKQRSIRLYGSASFVTRSSRDESNAESSNYNDSKSCRGGLPENRGGFSGKPPDLDHIRNRPHRAKRVVRSMDVLA